MPSLHPLGGTASIDLEKTARGSLPPSFFFSQAQGRGHGPQSPPAKEDIPISSSPCVFEKERLNA